MLSPGSKSSASSQTAGSSPSPGRSTTSRKENLPNQYALSDDLGASWPSPLESPVLGQTCAPLALPDNRILAVYRASPESGRRGLWATTARIEGTDWVEEGEDFCLWGEEQEVNHQPDTPTGEIQELASWPADV